jgi:WD40 repeat protein
MASVAASTASAAAGPAPQAAIYANSEQNGSSNNSIVYFDGVDGTQSVDAGGGHFPGTTDVAVSPDGRTIYAAVTALAGAGQPIITLVPVTRATGAAGSPLATEPGSSARVALSRDGTTAYLYSTDAIYPITVATGQVGGPFSPGPINQVAVSPDGTLLYVGVGNDFVALDARTGAVVHQLALGPSPDVVRRAQPATELRVDLTRRVEPELVEHVVSRKHLHRSESRAHHRSGQDEVTTEPMAPR